MDQCTALKPDVTIREQQGNCQCVCPFLRCTSLQTLHPGDHRQHGVHANVDTCHLQEHILNNPPESIGEAPFDKPYHFLTIRVCSRPLGVCQPVLHFCDCTFACPGLSSLHCTRGVPGVVDQVHNGNAVTGITILHTIAIFPEQRACLFVYGPGDRLRADRQNSVCVNSSNELMHALHMPVDCCYAKESALPFVVRTAIMNLLCPTSGGK